jgi:hypothetical protein
VGLPLPTLTSGVKVLFHTEYPHPPVVGVVLYAGAAPLEVAGLYQINVLLIQAFSLSPPIPPATVEIDVDLPGGNFFGTANALAAGPKISIQGIDVVK